jgi:hypothetical protein
MSAMPIHLVLLGLTFLFGCAREDYAVVFRKDIRSPDGRFVARITGDTHFDTTDLYAHVSLGQATKFERTEEKVFSCGPGEPVSVAWTSPTSLVVRYKGWARMPGTPPPPATNVVGVFISFEDTSGQEESVEPAAPMPR